jgi:hypothetical protein
MCCGTARWDSPCPRTGCALPRTMGRLARPAESVKPASALRQEPLVNATPIREHFRGSDPERALVQGLVGWQLARVAFLLPMSTVRLSFPWRQSAAGASGMTRAFCLKALAVFGQELLWVWLPAGPVAAAATRIGQRPRLSAAGSPPRRERRTTSENRAGSATSLGRIPLHDMRGIRCSRPVAVTFARTVRSRT